MKILYAPEVIDIRISEIAQEIISKYPKERPLFVCLLKGAVPFTSMLMSAITRLNPTFYPEVEYAHISAYGTEREASAAKLYTGIEANKISERKILVIDDCLDQGVTYTEIKNHLLENNAKSVHLVVLANKDVPRVNVEQPLISGFHTPNAWLVGMGMDDSATALEAERWSDYIGQVS